MLWVRDLYGAFVAGMTAYLSLLMSGILAGMTPMARSGLDISQWPSWFFLQHMGLKVVRFLALEQFVSLRGSVLR